MRRDTHPAATTVSTAAKAAPALRPSRVPAAPRRRCRRRTPAPYKRGRSSGCAWRAMTHRVCNRRFVNSLLPEHKSSHGSNALGRVPRLCLTRAGCSIPLINVDCSLHVSFRRRKAAVRGRMHEVTGMLTLLPITAGRAPRENGLHAQVAHRTRHEPQHLDACTMRHALADHSG